jgi:hypothetical protein
MMAQPGSVVRGLRLTGLGVAALAAEERVTPADLFAPDVYDAIRKAGLDVYFVRAEGLLGLAP